MKTPEQQLEFAKENRRLTDEIVRITNQLGCLKLPDDSEQILALLQEKQTVITAMKQLVRSYTPEIFSDE